MRQATLMSNSEAPLVRRLRSIATLTAEDVEIVTALPMVIRSYEADRDIVRQGDRPSQSCLILEGTLATFKITGPGRRQIMSFHIPGDVPDLHSLHIDVLDSGIGTLTRSTLGFIQHDVLRDLCRRLPHIGDALWRMTLIDGAILREWIVNIGQRDAGTRLAHLLCEMFLRLQVVGLTVETSCEWPITQQELADATGISVVHVNRCLQELRSERLLILAQRRLTVLDWPALQRVGDFDSTYLHLTEGAASASL